VNQADQTHCFEIDAENREHIRENLSLNSGKDVELLSKAVWNSDGRVPVKTGKNGESHVTTNSGEGIKAVQLDTFYEDRSNPDIIKIDVEGGEARVLFGAEKVLERSHPTLFIEFHLGERLTEFGHRYEEVVEFLEGLGYEFVDEISRGSQKLVVAK
jgi:FkbM family methyltransferase